MRNRFVVAVRACVFVAVLIHAGAGCMPVQQQQPVVQQQPRQSRMVVPQEVLLEQQALAAQSQTNASHQTTNPESSQESERELALRDYQESTWPEQVTEAERAFVMGRYRPSQGDVWPACEGIDLPPCRYVERLHEVERMVQLRGDYQEAAELEIGGFREDLSAARNQLASEPFTPAIYESVADDLAGLRSRLRGSIYLQRDWENVETALNEADAELAGWAYSNFEAAAREELRRWSQLNVAVGPEQLDQEQRSAWAYWHVLGAVLMQRDDFVGTLLESSSSDLRRELQSAAQRLENLRNDAADIPSALHFVCAVAPERIRSLEAELAARRRERGNGRPSFEERELTDFLQANRADDREARAKLRRLGIRDIDAACRELAQGER